MRSVVFKTPGKLDLRAFTIFGVTAKPKSDNPIGYFGTGLKYAVAVCLRNGWAFTVYTGGEKYEFTTHQMDFRGKADMAITMVRTNKFLTKKIDLPFTFELGRNWQAWQAFREVYANTLDENGKAFTYDMSQHDVSDQFYGEAAYLADREHSYIVVTGKAFVEEFLNKDKTFLPDAWRQQVEPGMTVQVFKRPSKHIYWRGMRVMDLPEDKHCMYTWNILSPIELTEDRTAKHAFMVRNAIEKFVVKSTDTDMIGSIVSPVEKSFERELNFEYETPSKEFLDVVHTIEKNTTRSQIYLNDSASRVRSTHRPDPPLEPEPFSLVALCDAIEGKNWELVLEQIRQEPDQVVNWLRVGESSEALVDDFPRTLPNENSDPPVSHGQVNVGAAIISSGIRKKSDMDDEIPF
jgi:hypothetical protein